MSVVADQVRRLDTQLDRIPFSHLIAPQGLALQSSLDLDTPRVKELLRLIKALSANNGSQAILSRQHVHFLISQSNLSSEQLSQVAPNQYEAELEWLLVSKATVRVYGIILDTLLDQMTPISDHIWYWDDILSSPTYTSLYMAQTFPIRLWTWSTDVYQDSKARLQRYTSSSTSTGSDAGASTNSLQAGLSHQWRRFYAIVRESIREKSLADVQQRVMSPVALCQSEARKKQAQLKKLREMIASGLGVLIDEGLAFGGNGSDDGKSDIIMSNNQEWKGVVERSVALMDMVLKDVRALEVGVPDFEDKVFAGVEEDPELSIQAEEDEATRPAVVARRLQGLLASHLPDHIEETRRLVAENGRPSRLVRYWLPATALLLSSTTILRIFVNRRQEILDWVRDFGVTVRDFWFNWVVEPVRKVIGTIRHDSSSEIAIMSQDSLKADKESLERMVIDFALDKPDAALGTSSISESQVAEIRARVREGDVTPVLRAYEKNLRHPFSGAVRGDLVRTLLIIIQKTKVDVEVAMSGIDALLKSQELVFGFVGLTPGILVSFGAVRYLRDTFGRRGQKGSDGNRYKSIRVMRNMQRILSSERPSPNNLLSYKDHGLLVCEIQVLRQLAHLRLPPALEGDFVRDLDSLANLKGIQAQVTLLQGIQWAYSEWLK